MLAEQRMTLYNDIEALHRQFEPSRHPAPKKRQLKEKKKRSRVNQKIKALQVERFLHLRYQEKLSYRQIGKIMTVKHMTVCLALKRYAERGKHVDNRSMNGRNNPRHKITPDL